MTSSAQQQYIKTNRSCKAAGGCEADVSVTCCAEREECLETELGVVPIELRLEKAVDFDIIIFRESRWYYKFRFKDYRYGGSYCRTFNRDNQFC